MRQTQRNLALRSCSATTQGLRIGRLPRDRAGTSAVVRLRYGAQAFPWYDGICFLFASLSLALLYILLRGALHPWSLVPTILLGRKIAFTLPRHRYVTARQTFKHPLWRVLIQADVLQVLPTARIPRKPVVRLRLRWFRRSVSTAVPSPSPAPDCASVLNSVHMYTTKCCLHASTPSGS